MRALTAAHVRGGVPIGHRSPPAFEKAELLRAKAPDANGDCAVTAADGTSVAMRPFMKIEEESYITYVSLKS